MWQLAFLSIYPPYRASAQMLLQDISRGLSGLKARRLAPTLA